MRFSSHTEIQFKASSQFINRLITFGFYFILRDRKPFHKICISDCNWYLLAVLATTPCVWNALSPRLLNARTVISYSVPSFKPKQNKGVQNKFQSYVLIFLEHIQNL